MRGGRDSQIDKIIEKEGRTGAKQTPAISLQRQEIWNARLLLEVVFAKEYAISHAKTQESNTQGQEDGDAVHGVKSDDKVVV